MHRGLALERFVDPVVVSVYCTGRPGIGHQNGRGRGDRPAGLGDRLGIVRSQRVLRGGVRAGDGVDDRRGCRLVGGKHLLQRGGVACRDRGGAAATLPAVAPLAGYPLPEDPLPPEPSLGSISTRQNRAACGSLVAKDNVPGVTVVSDPFICTVSVVVAPGATVAANGLTMLKPAGAPNEPGSRVSTAEPRSEMLRTTLTASPGAAGRKRHHPAALQRLATHAHLDLRAAPARVQEHRPTQVDLEDGIVRVVGVERQAARVTACRRRVQLQHQARRAAGGHRRGKRRDQAEPGRQDQ